MPVNPIALALSADATFVARGYAGNIPMTTELIEQAMNHKGFSLVDMFQPCVTFNKVNTHGFYQEKVTILGQDHDKTNREVAWKLTFETEKLPIGVFYEDTNRHAYHEDVPNLQDSALVHQSIEHVSLTPVLARYT